MKKMILPLVLLCLILTGCKSKYYDDAEAAVNRFNASAAQANALIQENNDQIAEVAAANKELDDAVAAAEEIMSGDRAPADPSPVGDLYFAIEKAREGRNRTILPEPTPLIGLLSVNEEMKDDELLAIMEKAGEKLSIQLVQLPEKPDYTDVLQPLQTACDAYKASLEAGSVSTRITDDQIMEVLGTVKGLGKIAKVTEENDPNNLMGTEGGYIGCVYFRHPNVPRNLVKAKFNGDLNDPLTVGTAGGGSIEIYPTAIAAARRAAGIDGLRVSSISGDMTVLGPLVIRITNNLNYKYRVPLMEELVEKITALQ